MLYFVLFALLSWNELGLPQPGDLADIDVK